MQESDKITDLITDESFQAFCADNDPSAAMKWTNWMAASPENQAAGTSARQAIERLRLQLPAAEIDAEFARFKAASQAGKKSHRKAQRPRIVRRSFFAVAATLLLLLFAGWFLQNSPAMLEYRTQAGELKSIQLPDGSEIAINANSTLRYAESWGPRTDREIWLEGEAFFSVTNTPVQGGENFVVHTERGDISVLGTKFNVYQRQLNFEVVLVEGKVKLSNYGESDLNLLPGQKAWLDANQQLQLEKVETALYTDWKNGRLIFRDMPISRVVNRLRDEFGITLLVPEEKLLRKKISAHIQDNDPYALIEALAALYELQLTSNTDSLELTLTE